METALSSIKSGYHSKEALSSKDFTVIIPAYNEEKRITPVLEELCFFIEEHAASWRVLVMIDGDDGTANVVNRFVEKYSFMDYVRMEGRGGKGGAVKRAADMVDSDFVVLMDADNSVSVATVFDNIHHLSDYDLVILSRYEDKTNDIPLLRRVISRGFNLALRVLLDLNICDTQSGYKMARTEVFKEAMSKVTTTNTFYDVALLYYINEASGRILEVPVQYEHSKGSTFHPIGEIIGQSVSLIAFKIRHSRFFDFIPESLTNLYYRKFKWM